MIISVCSQGTWDIPSSFHTLCGVLNCSFQSNSSAYEGLEFKCDFCAGSHNQHLFVFHKRVEWGKGATSVSAISLWCIMVLYCRCLLILPPQVLGRFSLHLIFPKAVRWLRREGLTLGEMREAFSRFPFPHSIPLSYLIQQTLIVLLFIPPYILTHCHVLILFLAMHVVWISEETIYDKHFMSIFQPFYFLHFFSLLFVTVCCFIIIITKAWWQL